MPPRLHSRDRAFGHFNPSAVLRRYGKLIVLILLLSFLCILLYISSVRFFTIRNIEVYGANIHVVIDKNKFDTNLLFFPTGTYRQEILDEFKQVEDAEITKKFPDTLVLRITLRKPIARIQTSHRLLLIDEQGIVVSDAGSNYTQLPLMIFPLPDMPDGVTIRDTRVHSGLLYIKYLGDIVPIERISDGNAGSLMAKSGRTDIFIPQEGDIRLIASTLQTLFSRFRMKGMMPSSVDVRFQKPIVIF